LFDIARATHHIGGLIIAEYQINIELPGTYDSYHSRTTVLHKTGLLETAAFEPVSQKKGYVERQDRI